MRTVKFGQIPIPSSSSKLLTLKKHFNITKEKLELNDIISLLDQMKIESPKLKDIAIKLYNNLNKKKNGFVDAEDLIEEIVNKKEIISEEEYSTFYNKINKVVQSKSDLIIAKLKRLTEQKWIENNQKSLTDIEWIIKTLREKNLYEIDPQKLTKELQSPRNVEIAYIAKISNYEDTKQKEKDYYNVRRSSKIYSTINIKTSSAYSPQNSLPKIGNIANPKSQKRRSTDLNSMISPSIIAKIYNQLCNITLFHFNIFELDNLLGKRASIYTATEILGRFDLIDQGIVEEIILRNFLNKIVDGYNRDDAIYHNDLHAGDVMQTTFAIVTQCNLKNKMNVGQLDIFAILIASLCHDFKHPGQNNLFQINSKSKYAIRYNDQSVLESYHIAQTMKVLYQKEYNIFNNFKSEEFRICKRRMIECIFATDMAKHQSVIGEAKLKGDAFNVINGNNFELIFEDDPNSHNVLNLFECQQCLFNLIVHFADISNPSKPEMISYQWTMRVYDEFFKQGDLEKERKLPVSPFCDRVTTNVNKAMIGFINFVVAPTIDILYNLTPEIRELRSYCRANLIRHQIRAKQDDKNAQKKASKNK